MEEVFTKLIDVKIISFLKKELRFRKQFKEVNQSQEKKESMQKFINMGYYLTVLDWVKNTNVTFVILCLYCLYVCRNTYCDTYAKTRIKHTRAHVKRNRYVGGIKS